MTDSPTPAPILILAGTSAAVGAFILPATVDEVAVRIVGALVGVLSAVAGVVWASRRSRTSGLVGAVVVPILVVAIGVPIVGVIDLGDAEAPVPADARDTQALAVADLDAQLLDAFGQADRMVPNGSASILELRFGWARSVTVLDPRNGNQVTSSRSDDDWAASTTTRATRRDDFSRSDLTGLSLTDAASSVDGAARGLGDRAGADHSTITIGRRDEDELLLVAFDSDSPMRTIQVDARGRLPDTLDAGAITTVMVAAARIMRSAGVSERTPLTRFDFKSIVDESTIPAASQIQNSGGIALEFDEGPVDRIVAVPGEFPIVHTRDGRAYPQEQTFVIGDLSQASVIRARDDLMRRHGSPTYDEDLVGFQIGDAPGDSGSDGPARLRLSVGPVNANVEGIYSLTGRFVRDGSW